jgi:hypothetical protein
MRKVVGIDRKIKRAWLDAALDRLAQTTDPADLRTFLDRHLKSELPGDRSRSNTTGIILRIWSGIPPERGPLRDRAMALLPRISGQERIWLHWGMTALAYPFFRDTAEVVGRLLALQDDFTTANVQGRMLTNWGDRATSKEAAQKLITMLVDWEVLRSTKKKGHFLLARKMTASLPDLQLWLLEALLGASAADEIEAQQLLRLPESFPFTLTVGVADLRSYEGFNIHRQGLDMDMVALRKVRSEPPPKPEKKPKAEKHPKPRLVGLFDTEVQGVGSKNGRVATPVATATTAPVAEREDSTAEQQRLKEAFKNELVRNLLEQKDRHTQPQTPAPVPERPFSSALAECAELCRIGRYLGCIALTLAVIEAVIGNLCQLKLKSKAPKGGSFTKNVEALDKKGFIGGDWKERLDQLWAKRQAFIRPCSTAKCDEQALEGIAREKLKMLTDLERDVFGVIVQESVGVHSPENKA